MATPTRKRRPRQQTQSSGPTVPIPVAIGGGVLFGLLLLVGIHFAFFRGSSVSTPVNAAGVATPDDAIEEEPLGENKFNFAYLLPLSELVIALNVTDVWNSQTVQTSLQNPMLQQLSQNALSIMRDEVGFVPEEIENVMIGIWRPYLRAETAATIVTRTKSPMRDRIVKSLGTRLSPESHIGEQYYSKDGDALYFPDETTVVFTQMKTIKDIIELGPDPPRRREFDFADPEQHLVVVFVPHERAAVLAQLPADLTANAPASFVALIDTLKQDTSAFSLGLTLGDNLDLRARVVCSDSSAAGQLKDRFDKFVSEGRQKLEQRITQSPPQMAQMFGSLETALNSVSSKVSGDSYEVSAQIAGGGEQAAAPILMALLTPAVQQAREAARRSQCKSKLKQLVLAAHKYSDANEHFPDAATKDSSGQPLLSWRVSLLPYLGHEDLYKQFHLNEPWDSTHNMTLVAQMPDVFKCPSTETQPGTTTYQVVVGPSSVYEGGVGRSMQDVSDEMTIMLVDVAPSGAVVWTQPDDFKYDADNPLKGLLGQHVGGFHAAFVDGGIKFINRAINPEALVFLFTRNGGETVSGL